MRKCDPRVYARCPYNKTCVSVAEATFTEDSDCARFNDRILQTPVTNADHIRGMSDMEMATFLYTATRACSSHNCGECPIGEKNCPALLHWLKSPKEVP